jgi:hypothetical protein
MTETPVFAALRTVLADLAALRARSAVVGGLAVSARTAPRFTRDVDLAVAADTDKDAERVVSALLGRGYRLLGQLEHADRGRLATVRLEMPRNQAEEDEPPVVDVLFAMSGVEPEVVAEAELLTLAPGLVAPVAQTGHLIALKVLSAREPRPQDRMDLAALFELATARDLEVARSTLSLIQQRGYDRGKDLLRELKTVLARGNT